MKLTLAFRGKPGRLIGGGCLLLSLLWSSVLLAAETNTVKPPVATHWPNMAELRKSLDSVPLPEIEQRAAGGELSTAHYLGYCYMEGLRVPKNPEKGVRLYEQALKGGYIPSANNLGIVYLNGWLGAKEPAKAADYFRFAAEKGLASAEGNLGTLYRDGTGVDRDLAEAVRHFQKAADAGSSWAMTRLYECYWDGAGVPADRARAMDWLAKAALAGDPGGQCELGYRRSFQNDITDSAGNQSTLPPNPREAFHWFRLAAEQNLPAAQYHLGLCYLRGEGTAVDEARGLELIRSAADQGFDEAIHDLVDLYTQGIGTPRNLADQPIPLLERRHNWISVACRLENGIGTERDLVKAARYYCRWLEKPRVSRYDKEAKKLGEFVEFKPNRCPEGLSKFFSTSEGNTIHELVIDFGTSDDAWRVLSLYLKSATGHGEAACLIGQRYLDGEEVPKSAPSAWAWFTVARQNGSAEAGKQLDTLAHQMSPDETAAGQKALASLEEELKAASQALKSP